MIEILLGNNFNILKSFLIKFLLKFIGIRIGKNVFIKEAPHLKINGSAKNIVIGDNIKILGKIDLRNRENGKIIFQDGAIVEGDCRFVAAKEGTIQIGKNAIITKGAIMNGGGKHNYRRKFYYWTL